MDDSQIMNVHPIRTGADLTWALREIQAYFDAPPAPGTSDGDRLDVLATLIEADENAHCPIGEGRSRGMPARRDP